MTAVHQWVCDGCGKQVELEQGHGWLAIHTMKAVGDTTPVEDLTATCCSLDCLVEWSDRKAFEERPPAEPFVRILPVNPPEAHPGKYL